MDFQINENGFKLLRRCLNLGLPSKTSFCIMLNDQLFNKFKLIELLIKFNMNIKLLILRKQNIVHCVK